MVKPAIQKPKSTNFLQICNKQNSTRCQYAIQTTSANGILKHLQDLHKLEYSSLAYSHISAGSVILWWKRVAVSKWELNTLVGRNCISLSRSSTRSSFLERASRSE